MNVYIYRPPINGFSLRKLKLFDKDGNFLTYVSEDAEVILKNSPKFIQAKIDWLKGHIDQLNQKETYLIVYFVQHSFSQWFIPSDFNNYFKFKNVSKSEYELVMKTKGAELDYLPKVFKSRSILSRVVSIAMLFLVGMLFYITDYSAPHLDQEHINLLRLLGLITGLGSIVNLIWNINKFSSVYPQCIFLIVFNGILVFTIDIKREIGLLLFMMPSIIALCVMVLFNLKKVSKT